ncbi:Uma2 family endonuclease [Streptomyces orinoci]
MAIVPGRAEHAERVALRRSHYTLMRDAVERVRGSVPGKLEITAEGIVHDLGVPQRAHALTVHRVSRRLERVLPSGLVAHAGSPDVENVREGVLRRPDVIVVAEPDMAGQGAFDPRTLLAVIEVVSASRPDNDWVGKLRDYPLLGIPVYAIFDPHHGEGAVLSRIRRDSCGRPRYTHRTDFGYGEEVAIGEWSIHTGDLPRYH